MAVALTNIQHGDGDNLVTINAGEEVKGLPSDVVKQLTEAGAVGDQDLYEKQNPDESEKVAELERELAAKNLELDQLKAAGAAHQPTPATVANEVQRTPEQKADVAKVQNKADKANSVK